MSARQIKWKRQARPSNAEKKEFKEEQDNGGEDGPDLYGSGKDMLVKSATRPCHHEGCEKAAKKRCPDCFVVFYCSEDHRPEHAKECRRNKAIWAFISMKQGVWLYPRKLLSKDITEQQKKGRLKKIRPRVAIRRYGDRVSMLLCSAGCEIFKMIREDMSIYKRQYSKEYAEAVSALGLPGNDVESIDSSMLAEKSLCSRSIDTAAALVRLLGVQKDKETKDQNIYQTLDSLPAPLGLRLRVLSCVQKVRNFLYDQQNDKPFDEASFSEQMRQYVLDPEDVRNRIFKHRMSRKHRAYWIHVASPMGEGETAVGRYDHSWLVLQVPAMNRGEACSYRVVQAHDGLYTMRDFLRMSHCRRPKIQVAKLAKQPPHRRQQYARNSLHWTLIPEDDQIAYVGIASDMTVRYGERRDALGVYKNNTVADIMQVCKTACPIMQGGWDKEEEDKKEEDVKSSSCTMRDFMEDLKFFGSSTKWDGTPKHHEVEGAYVRMTGAHVEMPEGHPLGAPCWETPLLFCEDWDFDLAVFTSRVGDLVLPQK